MQIVNYLDLFIAALLNLILCIFIIEKVFDIKPQENKSIVIMSLILSAIFISIVNTYNKDSFKILITFPFTVLAVKYVFLLTYDKSIIYSVFTVIYMFIAEIFIGILFSILPFDYNYIFNNMLGTIIGAILVTILTIPFVYIKKLKQILIFKILMIKL